ncbi:hypothetical protein [Bacillus thuringiensis]|uniref:hypothetical protein n=1 Tax=Bacillus thuringiensis TaxID=1428 RepID=UPI00333CF2EA
MNEVISLSSDINVITAEINSYKQMVGQSFFEIGRRLKHVKENDLIHGDFLQWLESLDIHPRVAQRMMRVASDPHLNTTAWSHLGLRVLYEIATISPEEREEPHTIPSTGEEKTVYEMSTREIAEVKKALKEKEKLLHQETEKRKRAEQETFAARKSEQLTRKQLEELEGQEPQIIEREVVKEVVVESKEHINIINELNHDKKKLQEEVRFYKEKERAMRKDAEDLQQERETMEYMADWSVHTLRSELRELIEQCSFSSLQIGAILAATPTIKENLRKDD